MDAPAAANLFEPGRVERFMSLYASHQRRLYLYIVSLLPGSSDAEDVLQEVNLVLWKKFAEFEPDTNFYAWACRVTRFEVLKHRERQARNFPQLDEDVIHLLADEREREEEHDATRRSALADCLSRLAGADRELIMRRYGDAGGVKAIAAATGRSANALSKALGRIRRTLMQCIEGRLAEEMAEGGTSP